MENGKLIVLFYHFLELITIRQHVFICGPAHDDQVDFVEFGIVWSVDNDVRKLTGDVQLGHVVGNIIVAYKQILYSGIHILHKGALE